MNTIGNKLRLTTFGESHGPAMGGIIDGFPPNFKINFDELYCEIAKRAPGSSSLVTQRNEKDIPEFLSGITENGLTLGTPIGYIVRNSDNRSKDYSELEEKYRPNHADYTYDAKYGIRDYRGGGRSSARETVNWVIAGALAQQWLIENGISIQAELTAVGAISFAEELKHKFSTDPFAGYEFKVPEEIKKQMDDQILQAKSNGDSVGGLVTCLIKGIKAGVGSPVFEKLHSRIAMAMMSINAAKGFEYGLGMASSKSFGSQTLDIFETENNQVKTSSNFSGGIQGGISNGMPIYFNVAFKPTPTIMKELKTIDTKGNKTTLKMTGRHDPCVAVRAVPVVKALTALVVMDALL